MTVRDPLWMMDGATALVDAEEARLGLAAGWETGSTAVKVASGVVPAAGTPLRVHQTGTASANLLLEAGQAVIQGSTSGTQGAYVATNDAQVTLTYLSAFPADAQPRKDIIVARINDKAYAGSLASFTVEVVKGTASGSPVDPTLPASCIPLARINLAASATTVADAVIDDLRTYVSAVGGMTVCTSSTRPANVYDGFSIYETDKDRFMTWNGSAWVEPSKTIPSVSATAVANVGPTSGTTELDVVTAPAIMGDGSTPVKVSVAWNSLTGSVAGDTFEIHIKEGATQLQNARIKVQGTAAEAGGSTFVVLTPSAGSHTYKATVVRVNGTGTATLAAASTQPITIAVEQFR